jgi:hypothetical protein
MGVLVVRCPKTRRRFSTGIQIEREDFQHIYEDAVTAPITPLATMNISGITATPNDAIPPNDWVENK